MPFRTDEKEYEEQLTQSLKKNERNLEKSEKPKTSYTRLPLDVDFIKNLGLDELPNGFGISQSKSEIDFIYA